MSSLLEQASLIVTPNAFKAGKLYSIKPTSGAGDLDVVRATTATRVNSAGLIESVANNVPRLDYTNGSCPSILVEPQRTNLLLRSEEFDDASWAKASGGLGSVPIVTSNSGTSPSGNNTADRIQFTLNGGTSTSDISDIRRNLNLTSSQHTLSFWIKSFDGVSSYQMLVRDINGITNQIVVNGNWQRYTLTSTYPAGVSVVGFGIRGGQTPINSNSVDVLVWGAQLELGSNATSYIPTVASAVTRNADVISKTGISDLIGQSEGTLFLDYNLLNFLNQEVAINNVYTNSISLGFLTDTTFKFRCLFFSNSIATNLTSETISALGNYKIAVKYKSGENKLFINGVLVVSNTSTLNFTTSLNSLFLNTATAVYFGNNSKSLKSMAIWKTQLSDAELIQLTTL